ncbi:hypothetical protein KIN20_006702 [Parelaphostrongylus tenuis]|uniref:Uncharacterized protein n=1 Tax=Parelaphostrongylus tenuis TaxID=148309 RepID=A0AAD5QJH5_PARTN|nr:hypothetical protein KIN20_006702 [Parelaphostrongylus tenuis]
MDLHFLSKRLLAISKDEKKEHTTTEGPLERKRTFAVVAVVASVLQYTIKIRSHVVITLTFHPSKLRKSVCV